MKSFPILVKHSCYNGYNYGEGNNLMKIYILTNIFALSNKNSHSYKLKLVRLIFNIINFYIIMHVKSFLNFELQTLRKKTFIIIIIRWYFHKCHSQKHWNLLDLRTIMIKWSLLLKNIFSILIQWTFFRQN